ncbi:MAG: lipoprotein [bacterium]
MKKIILIILTAVLILTGCSDAVNEGSKTAKKALELPDRAEVISDLVKIRNSVNLYYTEKGYFPESIQDLNLDLYCPTEDYNYDFETGSVKHKDFSQL